MCQDFRGITAEAICRISGLLLQLLVLGSGRAAILPAKFQAGVRSFLLLGKEALTMDPEQFCSYLTTHIAAALTTLRNVRSEDLGGSGMSKCPI